MGIFFRFRPLSQNQREQQTVNSSKPKTGAVSASRLSRKTWKEDGKQCVIFGISRFVALLTAISYLPVHFSLAFPVYMSSFICLA